MLETSCIDEASQGDLVAIAGNDYLNFLSSYMLSRCTVSGQHTHTFTSILADEA